MDHRLLVENIAVTKYCNKEDLFDLVDHDLRHFGLNDDDYKKCIKELRKFIDSMVV